MLPQSGNILRTISQIKKSRPYAFQPLVLTEVIQIGDDQSMSDDYRVTFPSSLLHCYKIVCNDSEIFCVSTELDEMWRLDLFTAQWKLMFRQCKDTQPPDGFGDFLWNGMAIENDAIVASGERLKRNIR